MKTTQDLRDDIATLRTDLNTITMKIEKAQTQLSDALDNLDGVYDGNVSAKDDTNQLLLDLDKGIDTGSKSNRKVQSTHYRMLALLDHYGPMPRAHIAGMLGIKEATVAQYCHVIHHNNLGRLQSRKGIVSLQHVGGDARTHEHFKL